MSSMSSHHTTQTSAPTLFHRLYSAILTRRERRKTIRALSRLDDRILEDIGLHRREIMNVAAQSPHKTAFSTVPFTSVLNPAAMRA